LHGPARRRLQPEGGGEEAPQLVLHAMSAREGLAEGLRSLEGRRIEHLLVILIVEHLFALSLMKRGARD